jgi:hypothetical protein
MAMDLPPANGKIHINVSMTITIVPAERLVFVVTSKAMTYIFDCH